MVPGCLLNFWNFPVKWKTQFFVWTKNSSFRDLHQAVLMKHCGFPCMQGPPQCVALSTNPKCKRPCVSSGVQGRLFAVLNLWFEVQYSPTIKNEWLLFTQPCPIASSLLMNINIQDTINIKILLPLKRFLLDRCFHSRSYSFWMVQLTIRYYWSRTISLAGPCLGPFVLAV